MRRRDFPVIMSGPTRGASASADPIGDGLRADMVAYWKMDEEGGTRADATGHEHEMGVTANGAVSYGEGKFSNGILTDDTYPGAVRLLNDDAFDTDSQVMTFWFWVKFNRVDLGDDQTVIGRAGPSELGGYPFEYYVAFASVNNGFYLDLFDTRKEECGFVSNPATILAGTWYFIYFEINRSANALRLSVNNSEEVAEFISLTYGPPVGVVNALSIGGEVSPVAPDSASFQVYGITDEVGCINRALTSDEKTYLYNSGAGRSLY